MAINDISQYFTLENGTRIANDSTFASLAANTRIKNKNSGSTFIKNSNYSNVFDRVSTFTEFIKATDFKIATSGSGNAVASISYTPSTRTVTQTLTTFATPAQLNTASNNLKSQAVGSISVSGRTVTYKNINGQTLGSFQTQDNNTTYSAGTGLSLNGTQFNVTRSNGTSNLWWNTEVTLGTVAGLAIKAKLPANPDEIHSQSASGDGGWVRFKSGLQIVFSSGSADEVVNFYVPFITYPRLVMTSPTTDGTYVGVPGWYERTPTYFKGNVYDPVNHEFIGGGNFDFIAIGFWK